MTFFPNERVCLGCGEPMNTVCRCDDDNVMPSFGLDDIFEEERRAKQGKTVASNEGRSPYQDEFDRQLDEHLASLHADAEFDRGDEEWVQNSRFPN